MNWRNFLRAPRRLLRPFRQIERLVFDARLAQSYWPEHPRKRRPRILVDLLWWLFRHGEVNHYYYVYGLDRLSTERAAELLPYRAFRRKRNRANFRTGKSDWSYVCLLRDKFLFTQLATSLGIPTPKAFALLDRRSVTWLERSMTQPLESLVEDETLALDGFCKRISGIQGIGAFPLALQNGRLIREGKELTIDDLRRSLEKRYLFQERIEQHPKMSALHPSSLNTVRLVTFCRNGKAELFSAALRVGVGAKSLDNWAAGGVIVGIDATRGELHGEGFFKPGYGGRVTAHPDSGILFAGFALPHFQEALALVTRLHEYLQDIHSIGWDIGLCATGPTIIEGNDDWEGGIPMTLESDFKRRFLSMYTGSQDPMGIERSL